MYTLDASGWVNAFDQREPRHATSRQLLDLRRDRAVPVIVPGLVLAEVAGAISRTRQDQQAAQALAHLPNVTICSLDSRLAHRAMALAAQHGLRGADAVYAAVAAEAGCCLVTLDNEQLSRLSGVVAAVTPAIAIAALAAAPEAPS